MKAISITIGLLICFSIILSGCQDQDPNSTLFPPTAVPPMTGSVIGSASSVYTLAEGTVTCPDSAAEYTLTLAKDNTLPDDTALTSPLEKKFQYFRLDIMAVMRILKDGKCLERDPSDDRVHVVVEGYYDGDYGAFKALSCSKAGTLSDTWLETTKEYVVMGQITCVYSEQMKYAFSFSNLALK